MAEFIMAQRNCGGAGIGAPEVAGINSMNRDLRNQPYLLEQAGQPIVHRPLIGVTMGREKSQRFFGLSLYIMNQTYVRTLENLGALPVMIPLHMTDATLRGTFERLDGLFLPGGEDIDPANYGTERHPLLGRHGQRARPHGAAAHPVGHRGRHAGPGCLPGRADDQRGLRRQPHAGHPQRAAGLDKHDYFPPSFERYRVSHRVDIEPDSRLARALGQRHEVNSMHHQGIDRIGFGLRVVARAEDGLPEALEAPALPFVVGVQWHPEELAKTDQMSANLFYDFVTAAASPWRSQVPAEWRQQFRLACAAFGANGHGSTNGNGSRWESGVQNAEVTACS